MSRLRVVGGVLGVCAVLALGARDGLVHAQNAPPGQVSPVFRGGVNYVLVDAYPQRNGQIVEGLTAADFQILEDGKPQTIDALEFVRVDARQPETAYRDPNTIAEMNAAAADPHARVFVVFLDTAHTAIAGSNQIRVPLVKTLNSIVGPADLFGVITQNQEARDLTLQRHVTSVEDQLSRYWTWGQSGQLVTDQQDPMEEMLTGCFEYLHQPQTVVPWLVDDGAVRRTLNLVLIDRRREERLLTHLSDLVAHLGSIREARSVLLMITDGWQLFEANHTLENEPPKDIRFSRALQPADVPTPQPRRVTVADPDMEFTRCVGELNHLVELDDAKMFRDVIALAQHNNVSVYPVSSAGLQTFDTDLSRRVEANPRNIIQGQERLQAMSQLADRIHNLQTIAENTGGIAVVQTNDLTAGMKRIVDDVSAYYLIGYYSSNPKTDGKFRKIDVKMKPPGVTVHARRGYMATGKAPRVAATPGAPAGSTSSATPTPVATALASLARVRDSADMYMKGTIAGYDVVVAVELGARVLASAEWAKGGSVTITAVRGAEPPVTGTATLEPGMRGVLVKMPVLPGKGSWKVTAKVASGQESLTDGVEVAPPGPGLLGDAMVYRATPSPRSVLTPVASFQFRRNERVHVEWRTPDDLDGRTARVLDRNGQPLPLGATVTEHDVDDGHVVAADVNLAPLAEGDYVLELVAQKGADHSTSHVAFRMMR